MLVQAAEALPAGLTLTIIEGYRPMSVQRHMHSRALAMAREKHPDWTEAQVEREAGRYSAPPDAITPPPHLTGGAVDVGIIDENGEQLDFRSPYEMMDLRHANPFAPLLTETSKANRALLRSVLEPTGLTNYVDEWWHWSYGDNGWALRVGAPCALYDLIQLPAD
jgi:D-alanyl-D-alanine dipeptidase